MRLLPQRVRWPYGGSRRHRTRQHRVGRLPCGKYRAGREMLWRTRRIVAFIQQRQLQMIMIRVHVSRDSPFYLPAAWPLSHGDGERECVARPIRWSRPTGFDPTRRENRGLRDRTPVRKLSVLQRGAEDCPGQPCAGELAAGCARIRVVALSVFVSSASSHRHRARREWSPSCRRCCCPVSRRTPCHSR